MKELKTWIELAKNHNPQVTRIMKTIPNDPNGSSEEKTIVPMVSQIEPTDEIPNIDFFFGDQQ